MEQREVSCALLCPGPSLADWKRFDDYNLIVAVNRAVLHVERVDAWVALDWKSITRIDAKPCTLYTCPSSTETLRPARWPRVREFDVRPTQHRGKTAISALYVAKELGATRIDVFGADWTDQPDFDGVSLVGTERGADRWRDEARAWIAACEELAIAIVRK